MLLTNALQGLICGPVRNQEGGPVEKVVAAGGFGGDGLVSTTDIYDVDSNMWSKGTPLPVPLAFTAVVPYKTTFLVVGGETYDRYSDKKAKSTDKVFLYDTSGEWTEMTHMKLSQPKSWVAAMLVPSSLFDLDEE